jgi:hypothetical protein
MLKHIINPQTNRPIKIGGVTWRRLVSDGLVSSQRADNELYEADTKEEAKEVVQSFKKRNKDPNRNIVIARDGKRIISARRRTTHKEISKNTGIAAARVLKKIHSGELSMPEDSTDAEVEDFVQQQVLNELMGLTTIKPIKKDTSGYSIQTPPSSDDEYTSEGDEYESD